MTNTNSFIKFFIGLLLALFAQLGAAGTLLVFDSPYLVAMNADGKIYGAYNMWVRNFTCDFLFMQKTKGNDSAIPIDSFYTGTNTYENRDKSDDIPGKIYIQEDSWILQTEQAQDGCGTAAGTFHLGPNDSHAPRYSVVQKIPAIGIRTVVRKTLLNDRKGNNFSVRKGFLTSGDVVAVIEQSKDFSYVRYSHPSSGKITKAWIKTIDLVNPFPVP